MELTVFKNGEFGSVRTVSVDGEVFFIGKDVAEILGYSNTRAALAERVDKEDKRMAKCDTPSGLRDMIVINESGLYNMVLSSNLPKAKKLQRWLFSEVLPSARAHGIYAVSKLLGDPDFAIAAFQRLKAEQEEKRKLEQALAEKEAVISALAPKAEYYDEVLCGEGLIPISAIAKDFGWSALRMNRFLYAYEVQYPLNKCWLLYQKYAGKGYTKTKTVIYTDKNGETRSKTLTYWTQEGRRFLYGFMKSLGYDPVMSSGS